VSGRKAGRVSGRESGVEKSVGRVEDSERCGWQLCPPAEWDLKRQQQLATNLGGGKLAGPEIRFSSRDLSQQSGES